MAHNRQHNEGRSSTDVFGNSVVLSGEALAESNAQAEIGLYGKDGSVGGYGKKRIGEQSRGQMNLTKGKSSSILTS
jgi:hypothetical protein|tara:strand:+ start:1260 stop:1487 length:228 start_codon:yes stop_codon:yes gene_type:complete